MAVVASFFMSSSTWLYRSRVIPMVEWSSILEAALGDTLSGTYEKGLDFI